MTTGTKKQSCLTFSNLNSLTLKPSLNNEGLYTTGSTSKGKCVQMAKEDIYAGLQPMNIIVENLRA